LFQAASLQDLHAVGPRAGRRVRTTWWRAPDRQRGLEQGWTLPAPIGAGPLVIEVATDALASLVDGDLHLGPPDGGVRGHGLAAWDDDGDAVAVAAVPTDAGFGAPGGVSATRWVRRFTTDSDVPVAGLGDANGDGLDDVAWRGPGHEVEIAYGTAGRGGWGTRARGCGAVPATRGEPESACSDLVAGLV
jgi:hypothetical protein